MLSRSKSFFLRNPHISFLAAIGLILIAALFISFRPHILYAAPCDAPVTNPIPCENAKSGNPSSEWDISGIGDANIQGFATDMSVNRGNTIQFKVNTNATNYRINIYRLGYYGGMGARKITTLVPSATLPQTQPNCLTDATTGLIDCGNWAVSASWAVPPDVVSGVYIAKLVRQDATVGTNHIIFIVRDDAGTSDLLFQTSDTTWQAYNPYGGNDLYTGSPAGRAYKVSYNRPFITRTDGGGGRYSWLFTAEYPMIRFLEANGYNVNYFTGVDSDRNGALIKNHKVFLSVGHDEYWSGNQRSNVEMARGAGVNLAFFSGNEIFWKTRWENSIDGTNTPNRTLVTYKETHANAVIDPQDPPVWTGTWRDKRFSPPADGGRPENALTGTLFRVNGIRLNDAVKVSGDYASLRFWRNTAVASLPTTQSITFPTGILGVEWDESPDNGFQPAGLIKMSSTTLDVSGYYLVDNGSNYGPGSATHSLTLYKYPSGSLVFGAGMINWSWGLDRNHDNGSNPPDRNMQQATVNLLADMHAQPVTLQSDLVAAAASTDSTPPSSSITSPANGASISGATTISGTATDTGGGVVAGVEVSVDGGNTWHPANGINNWNYIFSPSTAGTVTIKSRAVDDSGNQETPGAGITITAVGVSNSIWSTTITPSTVSQADPQAVEIGVKFRSSTTGNITGIRFYKGPSNTNTHVGNVWSSTGVLLGSVTFTGESSSGWQQANFSTPIAIAANTTYIASYHTNVGGYSADQQYFASTGVTNGPLTALASGVDGPNGVYLYGATSGFPNNSYQSTNYWVDVVFSTSSISSTPTPTPTVTPTPVGGTTSLWSSTTVPANPYVNDPNAVELGVKFKSDVNGTINGILFYKGTNNTGVHTGSLWTSSGTKLASGTFINETATGWQQVLFATPVTITANTTYVASYHTDGNYASDRPYFTAQYDHVPLHALSDAASGGNGVYIYGASAFPAFSYQASNYYVDVVFQQRSGSTTPTPPVVPSAASTPTPTPTPAGLITSSLWNTGTIPGNPSWSDPNAVELGVKFKADISGKITGIRFYKGSGNTGVHTGSLWTSSGTKLASGTFINETATGWQQVLFATPVTITANTTYVVSYFAPNGNYAVDRPYFTNQYDSAPLHALSDTASGGNGVYVYGSDSLPTNTFQASNYYVDVLFQH